MIKFVNIIYREDDMDVIPFDKLSITEDQITIHHKKEEPKILKYEQMENIRKLEITLSSRRQ